MIGSCEINALLFATEIFSNGFGVCDEISMIEIYKYGTNTSDFYLSLLTLIKYI